MRFVFVGAGSLAVHAARILLQRGHEVVIIERNKEVIDALSQDFDCGFLHGDGSRPAVLRQVDPKDTDVLLCLTGNDQANVITGLVGRSLEFRRVIIRTEDEEFEHICIELGLHDTVIPARTIGRYLADMVEGRDILELSSVIKGEARAFLFVAREEDEGPVKELELPEDARVIHLYRDGAFVLADPETKLAKGDEVVVMTHRKNLEALNERFGTPKQNHAPI